MNALKIYRKVTQCTVLTRLQELMEVKAPNTKDDRPPCNLQDTYIIYEKIFSCVSKSSPSLSLSLPLSLATVNQYFYGPILRNSVHETICLVRVKSYNKAEYAVLFILYVIIYGIYNYIMSSKQVPNRVVQFSYL